MTVVAIEGFDVYPDVAVTSQGMQARWLATGTGYGGWSFATGRFAGQAARQANGNGSTRVAFPAYAEGSGPSSYVIGCAIYLYASTTVLNCIETRFNGVFGTINVGVCINTNQQLYVYSATTGANPNAGVPLATSSTSISTGSWHYVELIVVSGTSIQLWLDGAQVINYSGSTGAATFDTLLLGDTTGIGGGQNTFAYDDIYITNSATRLGERRVSTLYPASNGSVAWTPLTATNYVEVSETLCDGDASYVSTSTAGASDLYNITSLPSTPVTIDAVQVRCAVRKSDSSSHILNTLLKSGSTTVNGANFAVASTYLYDCNLYLIDPNTGAAWTQTGVNSAQIGQTLVS